MNPYKRPDRFTRAAKAQGFPARSVFKLEEIDRRVKLLRSGQRVLDLGAAPGSWSLYSSTRIGKTGLLVAVDLQPLLQTLGSNCTYVQGDAFELGSDVLGKYAPYDVILSDMAPNTTGDRATDQARSYHLFSRALDVAQALGKEGSSFVGKIFMGSDFELAKKRVKSLYKEARVIRPEGVRPSSFEIFLVGIGALSPLQNRNEEALTHGLEFIHVQPKMRAPELSAVSISSWERFAGGRHARNTNTAGLW